MKKKRIKVFGIAIGIVLFGLSGCTIRTPETILKSMFGISLKNFDYTVEAFEEQGNFSDGRLLIVFKFNELTNKNIDYLKGFNPQPLPFPETERKQMDINDIPPRFLRAETGYYLYRVEKTKHTEREGLKWDRVSDFKIFIIDTENKLAVLYSQFG